MRHIEALYRDLKAQKTDKEACEDGEGSKVPTTIITGALGWGTVASRVASHPA